jgi:hypothetical protein
MVGRKSFFHAIAFTSSLMSAWWTQLQRQDSEIPRLAAILAIGFSLSRASSMARSRNSGGCGRGLMDSFPRRSSP